MSSALACLSALVLSACGHAAPVRPASRAVRGERITIRVDGRRRFFLLDAPSSTAPLPLALVFHGDYQTALQTETGDWKGVAATEHIAIAFPQGVGETWNAGDGPNPATRAGVDDLAFTRAVIRSVESRVRIDRTRVAAVGFSDGAFLSDLIGCRLAGEVDLVMPVEGQLLAPLAASCRPARPVSVLQVNATADPEVPYAGGTVDGAHSVLSAPASIARWAQLDRCASTRATARPFALQTIVTRTRCAGSATVGLDTLQGGDHDWNPDAGVLAAMALRRLP